MLHTQNISFSPLDKISLVESAKTNTVAGFLIKNIEAASPLFFATGGENILELELTLSTVALHFLFQASQTCEDDSGIIDHILCEFGAQHISDMKAKILSHLNTLLVDDSQKLGEALLHFAEGTDTLVITDYIQMIYPD
jgi:hypothetical protein